MRPAGLDRRPLSRLHSPQAAGPAQSCRTREKRDCPHPVAKVPLAQTDTSETAWEIAAGPALDRLAASLKEVGLINPPWLRSQPGGQRFRVVTGARRLKAAADLGWPEITVRLVPRARRIFIACWCT